MTSGSAHSGEGDATSRATTVVDRSFGQHSGGYDLSEIRRTGSGHRLRVRIRRDSHQHQSYALVEVLTTGLAWTNLANEPASTWHPATPYRSTTPTPLESLAERLFQRAVVIPDAE